MAELSDDELNKLAKKIALEQQEHDTRKSLSVEERKIRDILKESLEIQKDINKNGQGYLDHMKNLKKLLKEVKRIEKDLAASNLKIKLLEGEKVKAKGAQLALIEEQIAKENILNELLKGRLAMEKQSAAATADALKNTSKFRAVIKGSVNDIQAMGKGLSKAYSFLKIDDAFEMVKAIKMSALNMGVLGKQADVFSKDIQKAAQQTISYGISMSDIAEMQSDYSDELGRTVMLGEKGGEAMGLMAKASGLGKQGAVKMAAEMETVGYSAERTAKFTNQVMNDAHGMGLNSAKVMKNIAQNLKMLNKYNFKGGAKSLARMAESATKMGISMDLATPMADKLFNIEGAVQMSAQLQVLGGDWAKLADPFKLMYMARNDMEGLTNSIIDAGKSTAKFNEKTHEFDISALEMDRLRKIAEATGMDMDKLVVSIKNAAKFSRIKKQISFGFDEKTKSFVEATSHLNENGEAVIRVNGGDKLVKDLTAPDKEWLKGVAEQKEDLKKRAIDSNTILDTINNTKQLLIQLLVPFLEVINAKLQPMLTKLVAKIQDPKFLDGIMAMADSLGKFLTGANVVKAAIGTVVGFGLFQVAKWILNGVMLGKGFNMTASVGGGMGINSQLEKLPPAKGSGRLAAGIGLGLGGMALDYGREKMDNPESTGGKLMGVGSSALKGAGMGMNMFGPWGAAIGGVLGGLYGAYDEFVVKSKEAKKEAGSPPENNMYGIGDGVMLNPKDKVTKLNDGTMVAGTNENGNSKLANAILSAAVPGYSLSNYLASSAAKSGSAAGSAPGATSSNVNFGPLKMDINVSFHSNNALAKEIGDDLINDPAFRRNITRTVHTETNKAMSSSNKTTG